LRSAKKQNIDVKVLGEGLEWSANSLRLPLILKELKDVKDDTIVQLYEIHNGFVLNKLTGTYPAIIHIPYSKKYYNVLLRLAEDLGDVISR
jgi:hypothetical protein